MKSTTLAFLILSAVVGCNTGEAKSTNNDETMKPAENAAADNTDRNERDRHPSALTPGDQGGSEADRNITQQARQGVVGVDSLSINAKNVKIITVEGVVTLRGPVASSEEKATIAGIVQKVDGVKRIDNQLEIAAK